MKQNIKRQVYLVSFTLLGVLFGILVESIVELYYTRLLLGNFSIYSYGLDWADLFQVRDFFAVLLVLACGLWGYGAGKFWWRQIYELKKYPRLLKYKFKFSK